MPIGKPAAECCFDGSHWHRAAAVVNLRTLPLGDRRERCYGESDLLQIKRHPRDEVITNSYRR
jgi:hypothetical protein